MSDEPLVYGASQVPPAAAYREEAPAARPAAASFVAGFAARHQAAAEVLAAAFAPKPKGFAPVDPRSKVAGPRHFSPADPDANPTAGWDPFDPAAPAASNFADPVAAAHAAGFAEGLAAAAAAQGGDTARDAALVEGLGHALASRIDREAFARQLRQTVLFLVAKIVGETGVAPDVLAARIHTATDMLSDGAESAMLRVHPDDVALLDGRLPATIFAVGDAAVGRGAFVLESASTIVEDGPELWLDQLAAAIDRVAVPGATPAA